MKTKLDSKFHESQKDLIVSLLKTIGYDGHSIYKTSILERFPEALQSRFAAVYGGVNTGSPKTTVFDNDGNLSKKMKAVYGLDVLLAICNDLRLKYESKMGRGFQAQVCTTAIKKHFGMELETT